MIVDKETYFHIIGELMVRPRRLSETDRYTLVSSDFKDQFARTIFNAISSLYYNGASSDIKPIDVQNCLAIDTILLDEFNAGNGISYLNEAIKFANETTFDSYYNRLKKFSLLNDIERLGYDISQFYIEDPTDFRAHDTNSKFEELTPQDITKKIMTDLVQVEHKYVQNDASTTSRADDWVTQVLNDADEGIALGLPLQGKWTNEILSGAVLGTLTIRSAGSGLGKSRNAVGDACCLAYPIRYNILNNQWEQYGSAQKVLYIMTEQSEPEIVRMILSYLTGINGARFKYGGFSESEQKRIQVAKDIMQQYRENLILVRMPNPNIGMLEAMIKEQVIVHQVQYVFYDYIFIGSALLSEYKNASLRNDEILLMMATSLKNLAQQYNLCVFTSTQLNANGDDNTKIKNESALAGARAVINKADNGLIMARPTKDEMSIISGWAKKLPNLVTDVFKVRDGKYTQVKIWSNVDLGTLRKEDLFITDATLNEIKGNVMDYNVDFEYGEDDLTERINKYNGL